MKENIKQPKCQYHNLPIIKIELNCKKLICEKCIHESADERRNRLQFIRVRLTKKYQTQLSELKEIKEHSEKIIELFTIKNMVEAKKAINKSLPDLQKIIDTLLDQEIKSSNQIIKEYTQNELQKWKNIDGKNFNQSYLQFEQQYIKIDQKINNLKKQLKNSIADKMKKQVNTFYSQLFEF